jgi:pimeloyl-ACP methyl ester carboxylesterase
MELNWIEIGNLKSNETIIFLHEGLGCIDLWKGYPEIICTKLKVRGIVYDRSGYGKSPGSLTRRKANYLELKQLLQKQPTSLMKPSQLKESLQHEFY